ncbi:hypothetical protein ACIXPA_11865, partial [Bacteroides fragilis]
MCELGYFISSYRLSPYKFRFFPISNYRIHRSGMIFLLYFCCKPKKNIMKKILFILFTVQFILIPRITGSYGANSIGNNHGHSVTNQGKKTIKKDIFGDTVIEDNHGNRKTIKKDIFGDTVIEDNRGNRKTIKKDIFGDTVIEDNHGNRKTIK